MCQNAFFDKKKKRCDAFVLLLKEKKNFSAVVIKVLCLPRYTFL